MPPSAKSVAAERRIVKPPKLLSLKLMNLTLADLQSLLYRLITAPGGVDEALAGVAAFEGVGELIASNQRLSASERVAIYANAYFYRLLDVLKEDFSCTYMVLGEVDFHNLITGYLIEYPPSEPSILYAGRHLSHYLAEFRTRHRAPCVKMPFLVDLARLEHACIEVFHAADAEALDQLALRRIPPESWPFLKIRLHPAAQIFDIEWRVDALMSAIKQGQPWDSPEHASATILVWKKDWQVHYRALEAGESAGLRTTADSADFASICAALAGELAPGGETGLAAIINRMLTGWLNDGVLASDPGCPLAGG